MITILKEEKKLVENINLFSHLVEAFGGGCGSGRRGVASLR